MSNSQFIEFSGKLGPDDVTFISPATSADIAAFRLSAIKRQWKDDAIPANIDPRKVDNKELRQLLRETGFNDNSVRILMEVDPRLAIMAAESKLLFDKDPKHALFDAKGNVIGHKSFQIANKSGFRTVGEQNGIPDANTNASGSKAQSRHQWGQALDFWVTDKYYKDGVEVPRRDDTNKKAPVDKTHVAYEKNAKGELVLKDNSKTGYDDFTHVAWYFTKIGLRDYGLQSELQGWSSDEDDMRIRLGKSPDWGHIELPTEFRDQWYRDPKTGQTVLYGEKQRGTGIDPKLHPNAGPTYVKVDPDAGVQGAAGWGGGWKNMAARPAQSAPRGW